MKMRFDARCGLRRSRVLSTFVFGPLLIVASLGASTAWGVTVSGSTYAAETGGPTPNPTSTSFNLTNPVSTSDSIRSDVKYSHAQAWASASVSCDGIIKTTGGRGWVDTPPTATAPLYDNKANLWNATASGTQVIANYTGKGAAPEFTPFNFSIPGNGVANQFNAFPGNSPTDPAELTPASNGIGFVVNGGGGGPGSLPSFFDIYLKIDATAQQGNGQPVDLFHGTLLFDPGALTFQTTGGFDGVIPIVTGTAGHFTVSFPTIQGGVFNAVVGQPFQTNFNVYMTMGDPNQQFNSSDPATYPKPFDFSTMSGGPVGAVGAFAASASVPDAGNFMISVAPVVQSGTWNGGGADGNWSTPANWSGGKPPAAKSALIFNGTTNTITNNDLAANTQFNGITFAATAGSFTLGGNSVVLAGDINVNSSSPQTINLPLAFNGGAVNVNVAPGGSLALGALTFGFAPQEATFTALNVNSTVSATSLLVQTNSPVSSSINIAAGATLNLSNASGINALVVGTTGAQATTSLAVSGGGTLNVSGTQVIALVGANGTNGSASTLDMSGLSSFVFSGDGINIGRASNGTLHLANASNIITANAVVVGSQNTILPNATAGNLFLGAGANTFNLSTALIVGYDGGIGNFRFETSAGSVAINGINPGQLPNITVGDASNLGGAASGTFSLAGHNSTIQALNVSVGEVVSGLSASSSSGIVTFDTGTFNLSTLTLAATTGGNQNIVAGTFRLGGATPDTVSSGVLNILMAFNIASLQSPGGSANGQFIVNGGTANINADIVDASASNAGPRTTTLTLAGGTLDMMGHAIGSASSPIIKVNLVPGVGQQATLKNLSGQGINGNGLTMTGAGTLTLDGTNTYAGPTIINSGALSVIGVVGAGAGMNVNGGSLIGNGNLNTSGFIGESVSISGGTIRAGTTPGDVGQLGMETLTFHNGQLIADLGPSETADRIVVNGPLTIGDNAASSLSLNVTGTYATGVYDIIDYGGPLTRNSDFAISGPLGFQFALIYGVPGKVLLQVATDPNVFIWSGTGNGSWDTTNSSFNQGNVPAIYMDGSPVSFTDLSSSSATTVNIAATGVAPSIVSVASSTNNFIFQGGSITGSTGLIKDGTSTLTILNNNTYTGVTTILNGTIQVGNGATAGSLGTGPITNNGTLAYNLNPSITVANTITGTGNLQKLGTGTLTLTANNSYSGPTTISAGTLQVGNGGMSGSAGTGPISVASGAALVFNRSDNINITNTISGSGTLSFAGTGMVTFSGANTFSGGISVSQGTYSTSFLPSSSPGGGAGMSPAALIPLGAIVLNGGTFQYTGGAVTSSDTLTLGPPGGTLDASCAANAVLNLSSTAAVSYSSTSSPATLTLTGTSTGGNTLAAAINNPGTGANVTSVVKNGTGTWVLAGNDSYTGGTVVNHGTLRFLLTGNAVMGAVPVMVNNDATLEVANSTPALSNTPVMNNSTATVGLLITGPCLEIKSIDGSGATQVNAGADVTTDHIIQSALVIGGTGVNPATVTIDATDASGSPLSQDADSLTGPLASRPTEQSDLLSRDAGSTAAANGVFAESAALPPPSAGATASVPEPPAVLLPLVAIACFISRTVFRRLGFLSHCL
jgi:autotransporter-associated beta strand protein